jgi:hypothetical protein
MPFFLKESHEFIYADDANLTAADKDIERMERALSNDTNAVAKWCSENDMVLNAKKCSSILIASRQRLSHASNSSLNININKEPIPSVKQTKLLGVHLDNNLTWTEQIKHIHNKISSNLYLLKQIKAYLTIEDRKLFYNSYILPHFDYCDTIWGNCSKHLLEDLIKLQKKAARIILDKDYIAPSRPLFAQLKWMPLEDRIKYHRSIQVFKCVNNLCPESLKDLFTSVSNVHLHNTRSSSKNNFHIAARHTKSFVHLGSVSWNNLPVNVRNARTVSAFKRAYCDTYQNV